MTSELAASASKGGMGGGGGVGTYHPGEWASGVGGYPGERDYSVRTGAASTGGEGRAMERDGWWTGTTPESFCTKLLSMMRMPSPACEDSWCKYLHTYNKEPGDEEHLKEFFMQGC